MTEREPQREFLVERLAPRSGESILDVGCGNGEDLLRILRSYPRIRVSGVDRSPRTIRSAKRKLSRFVDRGSAQLVVGDAGERLPFPSESFDAVFSAELMECIPPERHRALLREIRRVLKPHGRVLVEHTDWDTQLWNAGDRDLERKLVHAFCDWTQTWMEASDGWMGRKLLGLFRQARRFKSIEVSGHVLVESRFQPGMYGYARAQDFLDLARAEKEVRIEEARRFLRGLASHHRAGTYFYSVTRYLIVARAA